MSNDLLAPRLHPDDSFHFVESHRPALTAGTLTVTVTHTASPATGGTLQAKRRADFAVQAPRFALQPTDIAAQFPPRGASGNFSAVLPHVILRRDTLPWERTARHKDASTGHDDGAPWLALLIFEEHEVAGLVSTVDADTLLASSKGKTSSFEKLTPDAGDDPKQKVSVLDLPIALAKEVLPSYGDLSWLATVRDVTPGDGRDVGKPQSVILANRVPPSVTGETLRYAAHLVSLEHQYHKDTRKNAKPDPVHWAERKQQGTVRLISLTSWSFSTSAPAQDLKTLLLGLKTRPPMLDVPSRAKRTRAPVVDGAVPMRLSSREGRPTAAWYRGPLVPHLQFFAPQLPALRAEALIRRDAATGMEDISYAAAWELGRLIAVRDPEIGIKLRQWKRHHAEATRAIGRLKDAGVDDIETAGPPPFALTEWFEQALGLLHRVPFDYLVPRPDLLPQETVMPFYLDPKWVHALMDGAFSVGRTSTALQREDEALVDNEPELKALMRDEVYRSGVLIRSRIVTGWPHLIVDGLTEQDDTPVKILRFDRLGRDTLLVIFDQRVEHIDIHPHPQAMHFAVPIDGATGKPSHERASGTGVLDIAALAKGKTHSGDFQSELVKGVPRLTVRIEVPK
ncbi:hypothetical protein EOI86_22885 [Hwanghaeella grinnelliae]|uniref:Uncharacterized protein n=1 Tax=Hwanghaeella grinnelliae TaxID=2500179 RepID=A0A3S2W6X3_9PROT|nr:hypothetical protein [Hwanghaeella grinnelliae]RVU33974.1 hypothetical protein EOI86_22885 [Hwanghaeella grinnelliae]